jgi:transcription initiation factor TFIIH subunit 2
MEDEAELAYRWERAQASWENVREDVHGNLVPLGLGDREGERERVLRAKRRKVTTAVRRGLIRYLTVAIDSSAAASEKDLRPCRLEMAKNAVGQFIRDYFDQNPISQLSLIKSIDGKAEVVTELSGNPKNHEAKLRTITDMRGDASLQNILSLSMNSLVHVPEYGTREVLIVYNSLKTRDPGDIFETIKQLKANKIRVSIICTAAELYICKRITVETHGSFDVCLDAKHFLDLLGQHSIPPAELQHSGELTTEFVYMGFPKRCFESYSVLASDGSTGKLVTAAYVCPRCFARTVEIPTQCNICGLQLNSSTHIARSYHHLFPVPNFDEVSSTASAKGHRTAEDHEAYDIKHCAGCLSRFPDESIRSRCPNCSQQYCVDCDVFIHESLHNCPGCLS